MDCRSSMEIFGTPLSAGATRVMLLGAGELGKEVIMALQCFGVEVIAVDRYPNAPGHQIAHHARVIDMSDPIALRALIARERPHIIVPEIEAIAVEVLAEVEREGSAEVIPTARAVGLTMHREGIRRLAAEKLGLPTSPYAFAGSLEEVRRAAELIGFPCFVKPVMSSSGKGQSYVTGVEELSSAWEHAVRSGRVKGECMIVEGRIAFDQEITQLTAFCEPIGHVQVHGDYVESYQPCDISVVALTRVRDIAARITEELGGCGVFGVELFVKGDEVWFSEVSPRPHDTGLVTLCSQYQSEFALHARAILGLPVDTRLREPGASAVIYGGTQAWGIVYEGVAEALRIPCSDLRLFGKPESFTKRRMGVALATGGDVEQARDRAKRCADAVRPRRHSA